MLEVPMSLNVVHLPKKKLQTSGKVLYWAHVQHNTSTYSFFFTWKQQNSY